MTDAMTADVATPIVAACLAFDFRSQIFNDLSRLVAVGDKSAKHKPKVVLIGQQQGADICPAFGDRFDYERS